jgi:hypothetical protein
MSASASSSSPFRSLAGRPWPGRGRLIHAPAAHAWLNLLGFVSLVVAGTLIHLLPTVLGARIAADRWADAAVAGLALGAPAVAIGMLGGVDVVARAGALSTALGAVALVAVAWQAIRVRGRWTTDAGWHRFIVGCLGSAAGWFAVAAALAAAPVVAAGADPAAWSLARWPRRSSPAGPGSRSSAPAATSCPRSAGRPGGTLVSAPGSVAAPPRGW